MSARGEPHPSTPGASEEDEALLARLRDGDEEAFAALVRRWHPVLVNVARRYVPTQAIAEEVAQEAWLGLLDGLGRFEGRSSLRTWLFRILINRAITRGTRERRTLPFSAFGEEGDGGPPESERFTAEGAWAEAPAELPEAVLERSETRRELLAALDTLPERQRAAVLLRDVAGLSGEEAAAALDLTPVHLRVLLHRGRGRLRETLTRAVGNESPPPGTNRG